MAQALWSQLRELLRAWWRVDRIRVSPREGRLLRLVPPCYLEYGGDLWLVESRAVGTGAAGGYVTYRCSLEGQQGELTVLPAAAGREQVRWMVDQQFVDVAADEFGVYGAGACDGDPDAGRPESA